MLFQKALIFLFSNKCLICEKRDCDTICAFCFKKLMNLEEYEEIKFQNKNLTSLIYFFKYEKIIRKLILQFKFFNKPYLSKVFSKIIVKNEKFYGKIKFYDIIIPVPMHKEKKKIRGYNQTELVATEIARKLEINYDNNLLIKSINTKMQSSLTGNERYKNIENAFEVLKPEKARNKRVILIDDVYTTGATLEECARVLKSGGAKEICAVVIAKD